jgi:hypothetical protein
MAITLHGDEIYGKIDFTGLSTDTKPTDNVKTEAIFYELDTGKMYIYNNKNINSETNNGWWIKPSSGGSSMGGDADTLGGQLPEYYAKQTDLDSKVDKITGKQLSTEDYTTTEKTKLSGIATGANNYTHPATHAYSMITGVPTSLPANGGDADTLGGQSSTYYAKQTDLENKVDKVAGKQLSTEDYTSAEKTKLTGIATSANNYVHPANHPASIITQSATARFVTDTEKETWNGMNVNIGDLSTLNTTDKTSIVSAINELLALINTP